MYGTLPTRLGATGHRFNSRTSTFFFFFFFFFLNLLDRGKLTHVSDTVYEFFHQMEIPIRQFFNIPQVVKHPCSKVDVIQRISSSEEVIHQWQLLTENEQDLIAVDEIFDKFVNEFVTIRDFTQS